MRASRFSALRAWKFRRVALRRHVLFQALHVDYCAVVHSSFALSSQTNYPLLLRYLQPLSRP